MSDLLEEALVDAEALKEAAMKTAKEEVLEKYSGEVKNAIDQLLEQEEFGLEGEPLDDEVEHLKDVYKEVELAHRVEDDHSVVVDLKSLEEQVDKMIAEAHCNTVEEDPEKEDPEEKGPEGEQSLEEGFFVLEEDDSLDESFSFDYETVPTGHTGAFTEPEREYALEIAKVKEVLDSKEEENDSLKENIQKKIKIMEQSYEVITSMENQEKKYKSVINKLKKKLVETNLLNTKLFYSNQALSDTSLNERQKVKIVEALTSADSPEKVKILFETLKDAVGQSQGKKRPKSLSEAVEKRSLLTVSPHRGKESVTVEEAISDRWKRLAGIK